jgi:hypothetical protein
LSRRHLYPRCTVLWMTKHLSTGISCMPIYCWYISRPNW